MSRKRASTVVYDGMVVLDAALFLKLSKSKLSESEWHSKEVSCFACSTSTSRVFNLPLIKISLYALLLEPVH